ncbi:ABC transporter ATP-binding protein [Ornithinicoccus halotolerans]|uniref:ABC transporter ATP-binding protein n=1 Tax=Ornithinicoccus halotolerans TaxID=1748220 RepID=UPI001E4158A7|nr:ABC transporter ATP-binding protein [Ornithinicoccus halotolerans]
MRAARSDTVADRPAVELVGLTKRYGSRTAVDQLDLQVRSGEVLGLLGPNGAGKTTTMQLLLGLARPTSGQVRVLGRRPGPGYLDQVGALLEGPGFYPALSGRANLRALATRAGVPRARVEEVLARVDLTGRAQDRYGRYSLGMKQRLGVAAALLKDPALVVLDEPTNGLDPQGMADMRATVRALAGAGCTVLLSSHLLGEVQQVCDRVAVMAHGRLRTVTTVAELRAQAGVRLRVRASPQAHADRVVADVAGPGPVAAEHAPRVTAALVRAGLEVHEVARVEPSLEEAFLALTGEGTGFPRNENEQEEVGDDAAVVAAH